MTRLVWWLRLLRWWFVAQRDLAARVVRLECALAAVRAEHEKELAALEALRDQEMALQRDYIAELRAECRHWEEALSDAERRVHAERVKGNDAWQEAGRLRRELDDLHRQRERSEVSVDAS